MFETSEKLGTACGLKACWDRLAHYNCCGRNWSNTFRQLSDGRIQEQTTLLTD